MRVLLQRVSRGSVSIDGRTIGQIGTGLVLLIGIHRDDGEEQLLFCADKCADLRIFSDDQGKMNGSLLDVGGAALAISQFTLYGNCRKGRRPGFDQAARPEEAKLLYERFIERLVERGLAVEQGVFGANMQVEIHNDGPVTLMVESP